MCYDGYVTINRSTPSRSGLYAEDLPGVDSELWSALNKSDQTEDQFWQMVQDKAWNNLVSDLTDALQNKFYVDSKLISRETSRFLTEGVSGELSGVQIEFTLPRYARIHIISADVISGQNYSSPEGVIQILDENDNVLSEHSQELTAGKNTFFIDTDYENEKIKILFDPSIYTFQQSENKRYKAPYYTWNCNYCAFDCGGYEGRITQINQGGINVVYNVICSVEKFLCQNINLFKQAFFFRVGLEIIIERGLGNRLNKFITMTEERYGQLMEFYNKNYLDNLERSVRSQNIVEDPYCFKCKSLVSSKSYVP